MLVMALPARACRSGKSPGFTLVELMTVIAVLAITSAVAAPGLREFADSQRVKSLSYDLTADLLIARSEALKRNASVTITRQGDTWNGGWTVTSGGVDLASRSLSADSIDFIDAPSAITFNQYGRVSAPADGVRMTIYPAAGGGESAKRCVELDPSGRARAKVGACT
jgi:type IV fimbrial biogenesis protein FimT